MRVAWQNRVDNNRLRRQILNRDPGNRFLNLFRRILLLNGRPHVPATRQGLIMPAAEIPGSTIAGPLAEGSNPGGGCVQVIGAWRDRSIEGCLSRR
jgi:hypothetical protein